MTNQPEEPSDDDLIQAYAGGDVSAFERLFRRHRRPLFTYLAHQAGNAAVAEDLFQEVFLRVIRGSSGYRPAGNFRSWLFAIAHNVMTDDRRRTALRAPGEHAMGSSTSGEDAEPTWEQPSVSAGTSDPLVRSHTGELRERIAAALLRLPEAQREVFLLRERAGLDLRRIAEVTGANLATVKSRMRYALAGLRRLLSTDLASLPESFHD